MFEKEAEEYAEKGGLSKEKYLYGLKAMSFKDGAEFGYNKAKEEMKEQGLALQSDMDKTIEQNIALKKELEKANEWHYVNENYKDLPNEGEWVEGLYIWYYKDEPHWDVFKVRWCYEIGELDEKLVRWYSSDETNWNKVDEPDYWRKITLPTRNEHDIKY